MKKVQMFMAITILATLMLLTNTPSEAAMMGPGTGMMSGPMMTSSGTFGMMNGMAGSPVVGDDGTAYLVTYVPGTRPSEVPSNSSFQSSLLAVTPLGSITSLTLGGIVSRPVVTGNLLVATASLPVFTNYMMYGSFGNSPANQQSVLYLVSLPLTGTVKPTAVSLDGDFASAPVVDATHNRIYVTTTDFGNGMMTGSNTYNMMYGTYAVNPSTAKTYLYIINFDGTYKQVTIQ